VEGVVAKRLGSAYQPGARSRDWVKVRARSTTEAIIGGVTGTVTEPDTVLLGRFDPAGRLRYLGRTSPLRPAQRRELAALLTPAGYRSRRGGVDHPWPQPLPAGWTGRFQTAQPLPYVRVEPTVVAEVHVDAALQDQRTWRHGARYQRARPDLSVYDVPLLTTAWDDQ
jgi:ATP-dependent DNA ligase